MTPKPSLLSLPITELNSWFAAQKQPKFRVNQLLKWLYSPGISEFDQMTNLPKSLREALKNSFTLRTMKVAAVLGSEESPAEKFLLELEDGNRIEAVILHNAQGQHSLCASTQVGCAMKCAFCASGMDGMVRNLTSGEILEQFLFAADLLAKRGQRLSHAVIMGMGEPTANLDSLLSALAIVSSEGGLGIGARKITISTVGIPAGILRLAELDHPYHLAISLHAPNDSIRTRIMPSNRGIGMEAILRAADSYFEKTGRRVTYEYILIAGVNDSIENARELAGKLRGRNALVNLIPFNPVKELAFRTPSASQIQQFARILESNGIQIALRHRKGEKIDAACGQLRRSRGINAPTEN
ncbi:MAG: 23S rRNA (adenine(2503)-C(2))-methyltransferase RlmN [Planctomycetaceae bacterium]|nr:23S rRNA (adenine(2503)-C(2))-methyltransferase RlmN [Planctomycetaceae bacterium]MBQ2821596.1 23S rRNA (adenine(2503)-C(2))-methyltransferase RlmN [Thermoguttaceae bacterium]MDO4425355.1 23S rRNA (adenine(2503)-C(2))-methyltransferase RlmN [Planctomycetia bacterium]